MKTLIVCVSVSHGNTKKIADAMAGVLDATVVDPDEIDATTIAGYDLVGFGSGIFGMAFHPRLRDFVRNLPRVHGRKAAFVFATRGGPKLTSRLYLPRMERLLGAKGFHLAGTFSCLGYDTWRPLQLVGGLNKGHPDVVDLDAARSFAASLTRTRVDRGMSVRTVR